ncbi:hypothetical protein DB30_00656 [Enhygromyxa salina]|uniref:PAAR motif protein n=1 Tax=Enhygromyxa salina TaxID=215803 RepID=A0A0C2D5C7_9BACT|nr:PAAR domain-containing protein [Enhygromyxa salina]KIG18371.1 hypothetical protein DB30_00656 [Enhygromyxa salina]
MPHAARLGDPHTCPLASPNAHVGGVILAAGSTSVVIDSRPAAMQGSTCACGPGPVNEVAVGSTSVTIDRKPAARIGDPTTHGGVIVGGSATVLIG